MAFEGLTEKLSATFKKLRGKGRLSESDIKEAMREIRLALLEADVSYKVVKDFTKSVSVRCVGVDVLESLTPAQMIVKIVNEELTALMGNTTQNITTNPKGPTVLMLVGLQGAGKTTNGSKLAGYFKRQGKNPLLVACDVYRPAAIKQLEVCGEKLGLPVFQMGQANPVDIAKAAVQHAVRHGNDMVFLDTAGRLHVDEALMEELKSIKAEVNPQEIMLVVDAMTGQDAVNAAQTFNEWLDIDSVHPDRMASRILGMGDMLSLIEKAERAYDAKKAAELEDKLKSNKFTLADFYDQLVQLKSMGSVQDILAQLPGGANMKNVQVDEKAMTRTEAIILSMTPQERDNPSVINASRRKRIAVGAGVKVEDVNKLLKQFETMRAMVRQFSGKKMKRFGRKKGMPGGIPGGFGL